MAWSPLVSQGCSMQVSERPTPVRDDAEVQVFIVRVSHYLRHCKRHAGHAPLQLRALRRPVQLLRHFLYAPVWR